jgi:WD40 repeat protein
MFFGPAIRIRIIFVAALSLVLVGHAADDVPEATRMAADAMRLLNAQCLSCHSAEKRKGGLELTSREKLMAGAESGAVINMTNRAESVLLKVLAADSDPHMPPKKQLSPQQISVLTIWVEAGAPWDSATLAKASAPRTVKLETLPPGYQPALAVAISPDGKRLAFGRGNRLLVHDLAATNFPLVASGEAHADVVRSLAWNVDGNQLASGSYREIKMWALPRELTNTIALKVSHTFGAKLQGRVTALRFSPHGGALVAADSIPGESGWLRVLDLESKNEISAWSAHDDAIHGLALSPDGGFAATAGSDKLAKLWELISKREIGQIEAHADAVLGLAFSTNATELLTVSSDKQLKLWDVRDRHSIVTIGPRKYGFTAVAWSADGKTAVAAGDNGVLVRFANFKAHTGAQSSETADERVLKTWNAALQSVAISGDGSRIAAGAEDGSAFVTDREGKVLHTFKPESESAPANSAPSFVRDVLPMLAKAGCMAGSCHAKAEGQNGFKLSVFSYDPKSDFSEMISDAHGRRVFPAAPEESLLLLKPTAAVEHGGGERFERGSETYKTLLAWIRGGMVYQHEKEPVLARITVAPNEGTYKTNASFRLAVTAHYSDGSRRNVTELADFVSNDKEIAKVTEEGAVSVGTVEGEGIVVARYMGFVDSSRIMIPASRVVPQERYAALPVNNYIDRLAYAQFRKLALLPSDLCSDAEFLRRSSLDVIGMLPTPQQVREFLADEDPGKRKRWIEELLQHPAYADYWANKWTDLLRPNPDRVGVKSIYYLDQWLRECFRENKPYDQFVREILLAEGSNHQEGPGTIYRDRREPQDRTTLVSQLFLGVRMECAKCHHHPTEKWTQDDFYQFAAFFGPVKQKGAGLSPPISAGREVFYFAPGGTVKHPVSEQVMQPRPLDAKEFSAPEKQDPRAALADWMIRPENPFFAKAAVNRIWAAFFGRGFVDPVDDFRISNPVSQESLLNALAADFVRHGYDLKHVMRTILSSRIYQLSSVPNEFNLKDTKNFSRSYRRRLPAEVLLDAVNDVTETQDEFNGCPPGTRAIQTWSYKVRSHFMDAFGRPNSSTDCPCERDMHSSVVQSLHMMNSQGLQAKLANATGRVKRLADSPAPPAEIVTELYLAALSRFPSTDELQTAAQLFAAKGTTRQTATEDVLWALLNSPEFVFNH